MCSFILLISEKAKVNALMNVKKDSRDGGSGHIAAHTFTFRELAAATKNFRADCLLGEGGFGRVYKGRLESTNQVCYTCWILNCLLENISFCQDAIMHTVFFDVNIKVSLKSSFVFSLVNMNRYHTCSIS